MKFIVTACTTALLAATGAFGQGDEAETAAESDIRVTQDSRTARSAAPHTAAPSPITITGRRRAPLHSPAPPRELDENGEPVPPSFEDMMETPLPQGAQPACAPDPALVS